jgi:hypothetical protein
MQIPNGALALEGPAWVVPAGSDECRLPLLEQFRGANRIDVGSSKSEGGSGLAEQLRHVCVLRRCNDQHEKAERSRMKTHQE